MPIVPVLSSCLLSVLLAISLVASASATFPHSSSSFSPSLPRSQLSHATTSTAAVNFTPVFTPGEEGYPCIRIPSLILVQSQLLAFAEVGRDKREWE